ncbi:cysteine-rich receptor-like protein kinase 5 [Lytechinus variegatus]|uniref:cysteine-rich receptor-like protein kinase 5 n=1 Tax=Lytechinus variegatus TaxID=7654 RepID=UPI001BB10C5A|nr:cysteine-rich receptor-like protein kinase 5 [Lytechinus variegatus]
MKEMIDLMENKALRAEKKQKEAEEEIQSMKASVTSAAIQHGLLESVEDSICLTDLFEALDGMKQLNAYMKREIADLKKTKQTYVDMISLTGYKDPLLDCGDSAAEISPGERERYQLTEVIDDQGFQICKLESMIKKLRYQLSVFHKNVLHEKNSMYDNMTYIDRAVVESIQADIEIPTIKSKDLSFLVGAYIDEDDDLIGKGSFGEVFLREYQGEAVAVKVPYISEGVRDEDDQKRMIRINADHARTTMEALVNIAFADHPSFPKTVGIVDIKGAPSLILEFLGDKKTGTSFPLSHAIKFQIPSISKENWFAIIMDIISGIKAMHEKGLLHNDLKANNILLQWDLKDQRWHAFIIDMGKVSTQTIPLKHKGLPKEELEGYKQGILFPHLAPEYILDLQPMSVQTDIYSLGVLLARIDKVLRSRHLRDLTAQMTNVNPRLRPSWKIIEKVITKAQKRNFS